MPNSHVCSVVLSNIENQNTDSENQMEDLLLHHLDCAIQHGFHQFRSPLATEMDIFFCELLLQRKKREPFLTLECIPLHEEVASDWSESLRDRFFSLLEFCDTDRFFTLHPYPGCMADYAKELVANAGELMILGDSGLGLPFLVSRLAQEEHLPVVSIDLMEMDHRSHTLA